MTEEIYISITGLRLRRAWHGPAFWWHAVRSMAQARNAPGNIEARARRINGVHHTVSAWRDRAAMLAYLADGAHLAAMRQFPKIASGKTYGYTAAAIPDWPEVHALWRDKGRPVQGRM